MKIHDCIQGTPEWFRLRCGIPTASEFDRIVTPTGKASEQAPAYMCALLAERIMGHPRKEFTSLWMERGQELEADAALFYELQKDVRTVKIGFLTNDEETIGASPDRGVGEDGLVEIKCPKEETHVRYMLYSTVEQKYYPQVQGQLWISGRQWVDILSYHPEMPPALIRVERDEEFIGKIERAVTAFSKTLEQQFSVLLDEYDIDLKEPPIAPNVETVKIPRLAPLEDLVRMAKQALAEQ